MAGKQADWVLPQGILGVGRWVTSCCSAMLAAIGRWVCCRKAVLSLRFCTILSYTPECLWHAPCCTSHQLGLSALSHSQVSTSVLNLTVQQMDVFITG